MAETQKAIDLYADNPAPWQFLADGLRYSKVGSDWKKRADEAEKRARSLCAEKNERKVARMLANDFRLVGCKVDPPGLLVDRVELRHNGIQFSIMVNSYGQRRVARPATVRRSRQPRERA